MTDPNINGREEVKEEEEFKALVVEGNPTKVEEDSHRRKKMTQKRSSFVLTKQDDNRVSHMTQWKIMSHFTTCLEDSHFGNGSVNNTQRNEGT